MQQVRSISLAIALSTACLAGAHQVSAEPLASLARTVATVAQRLSGKDSYLRGRSGTLCLLVSQLCEYTSPSSGWKLEYRENHLCARTNRLIRHSLHYDAKKRHCSAEELQGYALSALQNLTSDWHEVQPTRCHLSLPAVDIPSARFFIRPVVYPEEEAFFINFFAHLNLADSICVSIIPYHLPVRNPEDESLTIEYICLAIDAKTLPQVEALFNKPLAYSPTAVADLDSNDVASGWE